jgi:hypothetical protein
MKKIIIAYAVLFLFAALPGLRAEEAEGYHYNVAKAGLRLRDEPSAQGKVLTIIPFGEKIYFAETGPEDEFEGIRGNWIRIEWSGTSGWIFDGFTTTSRLVADEQKVKNLLQSQEWGPDAGLTGLVFKFKQNNTFDSRMINGGDDGYSGNYKLEKGVITVTVKNAKGNADQSFVGKSIPMIIVIPNESLCYGYKLESFDKSYTDSIWCSVNALYSMSERVAAGRPVKIGDIAAETMTKTIAYTKSARIRTAPDIEAPMFEFYTGGEDNGNWSEEFPEKMVKGKQYIFSKLQILAKTVKPDSRGVYWYYMLFPAAKGIFSDVCAGSSGGSYEGRMAGWIEADAK